MNEEYIRETLGEIKRLIKERKVDMIMTDKNKETKAKYGLTIYDIFDRIMQLDICDYMSGPEEDRDRLGEINIWKFGKDYNDNDIYIKLKLEQENVKILSFHDAEYKIKK